MDIETFFHFPCFTLFSYYGHRAAFSFPLLPFFQRPWAPTRSIVSLTSLFSTTMGIDTLYRFPFFTLFNNPGHRHALSFPFLHSFHRPWASTRAFVSLSSLFSPTMGIDTRFRFPFFTLFNDHGHRHALSVPLLHSFQQPWASTRSVGSLTSLFSTTMGIDTLYRFPFFKEFPNNKKTPLGVFLLLKLIILFRTGFIFSDKV